MDRQWMELGESRVEIRRDLLEKDRTEELLSQVSRICAGELTQRKGRPALPLRSGPETPSY